jgi:hypothetical protein
MKKSTKESSIEDIKDIQIKVAINYSIELYKIDWGEGEWLKEYDFVYFIYKDMECHIMRNRFGTWCGYVMLSLDHPWTKIKNPTFNLESGVHGGITYAREDLGRYIVGFDCAHGGDLVPATQSILKDSREKLKKFMTKETSEVFSKVTEGFEESFFSLKDTYKNIFYAIEQCQLLANEAIEASQHQ